MSKRVNDAFEDAFHSRAPYKRCYESHKPLPIVVDGQTYLIYGGSCADPIVKDADVYVGFDYSMPRSKMMFPWEPGESFLFHIADMHAPADYASFHELIKWLAVQLIAQKKVHIGCIGGHGRTGTVMAALVNHMTGIEDAITYVRENYCHKAVEAAVQVRFLNVHYGIKEVHGAKEIPPPQKRSMPGSQLGWTSDDWKARSSAPTSPAKRTTEPKSGGSGPKSIAPTRHRMNIWANAVKIDNSSKSGIIQK